MTVCFLQLSIHDLTRRSTLSMILCNFQSSLSIHDLTRRSTHSIRLHNAVERLSIHDLTRRSTVVRSDNTVATSFQFTTSQGGRHLWRPVKHPCPGLSIHDLTRRSTKSSQKYPVCMDLSIHDLTRRSTFVAATFGRIHVFQFTTSQGGRQYHKK